jgi:hypothetical protein
VKLTKEQRDAIALYRGFREATPRRVIKVDVDIPKAVAIMGPIEFIGYRTTHGAGKKRSVLYTHEFASGSRPFLCAGPRDNQLYVIGGRFRVTERGIVDLSASGAELEDDSERYNES